MPDALWIQNGTASYDAGEDRHLIGAMYNPGVVQGLILSAGAGLSVNVSAGRGVVSDGLGAAYLAYTTSTSVVTLAANTTNNIYLVVNATTAATTVVSGATPSSPNIFIGSAITSGSGVTSVSNVRTAAESPTVAGKYLPRTGGAVTGEISADRILVSGIFGAGGTDTVPNAPHGVRLGGTSPTARHYARVHRRLTQTIENAAWEPITFQHIDRNVTDYDIIPFTGAAPGRLYAGVAGTYQVSGQVMLEQGVNTAGYRFTRIRRFTPGGSQAFIRYCEQVLGTAATGAQVRLGVEGMIDMNAGDWVEFEVYQNSGVSLPTSQSESPASGNTPHFAMRLIQAD